MPGPDVVDAPAPPGFRRRIPSKRRRRRWLAAFLTVWALVAAATAIVWYEYGRLSHDLTVSNRRVGGPVQHALTPTPAGAARQTILVAGIDSRAKIAGAVIVARIDATRHAVEILTIPSTVGVTASQTLRNVVELDGIPRAIGLLQHELDVPVNHVLLIHVAQAGSIVGTLGGVTVRNPTAVTYDVPGGQGVFPPGRLHLTGRTVQRYLDPTDRAPGPDAAELRQAAVVSGVTDRLVHISSPSAMDAVGETIAHSFTTDLSPDPVLGIVAARLQAHTLYECRLGRRADLTAPEANATLRGFRLAARLGACDAQKLQATLPAAAVAATIIATLVSHGGSHLLYLAVVASVALWGFAAVAWVLMLPAVRGLRPLRRLRPPVRGLRPRRLRPPGRDVRRHRDRGYGSPDQRRRRAAIAVRLISVPASIGLGLLIAHVLY